MRNAFAVMALVAGVLTVVSTQAPPDQRLLGQLKQLFPNAASFSPKVADPPHYKALGPARDGGAAELIGLAFWTTEMEPLERAYDGPIRMLVGMDTNGVLTGVVVVAHNEPYGDFSIDLPEFPAQFKGKSIRDPFRVGGDIDAVSRATITVSSAARAVRNSARRIAVRLLAPPK
jgi:NosR/NirI family transcriptional regulator, nitrous oxide reductase regulator